MFSPWIPTKQRIGNGWRNDRLNKYHGVKNANNNLDFRWYDSNQRNGRQVWKMQRVSDRQQRVHYDPKREWRKARGFRGNVKPPRVGRERVGYMEEISPPQRKMKDHGASIPAQNLISRISPNQRRSISPRHNNEHFSQYKFPHGKKSPSPSSWRPESEIDDPRSDILDVNRYIPPEIVPSEVKEVINQRRNSHLSNSSVNSEFEKPVPVVAPRISRIKEKLKYIITRMLKIKSRHTGKSELEELNATFNTFDTDKDGMINAMDIQRGMRVLGAVSMDTKAIHTMMKSHDENGDGKLDFREFIEMMLGTEHPIVKDYLFRLEQKNLYESFKNDPRLKPVQNSDLTNFDASFDSTGIIETLQHEIRHLSRTNKMLQNINLSIHQESEQDKKKLQSLLSELSQKNNALSEENMQLLSLKDQLSARANLLNQKLKDEHSKLLQLEKFQPKLLEPVKNDFQSVNPSSENSLSTLPDEVNNVEDSQLQGQELVTKPSKTKKRRQSLLKYATKNRREIQLKSKKKSPIQHSSTKADTMVRAGKSSSDKSPSSENSLSRDKKHKNTTKDKSPSSEKKHIKNPKRRHSERKSSIVEPLIKQKERSNSVTFPTSPRKKHRKSSLSGSKKNSPKSPTFQEKGKPLFKTEVIKEEDFIEKMFRQEREEHDENSYQFYCRGCKFYNQENLVKALKMFKKALAIVDDLPEEAFQLRKARCLHNIGLIHQKQGEFDVSLQCYDDSMMISEKFEDYFMAVHCLTNMAIILYEKNDFESAIRNLKRCLRYYEFKIRDDKSHINCLRHIASICDVSGDHERAIKCYNQALDLLSNSKDQMMKIEITYKLASSHLRKGNFEQGILFFDKVLKKYRSLPSHNKKHDQKLKSESLHGLACCQRETNRLKEALENFYSGLSCFQKNDDKYGIMMTYFDMGITYRKLNHYEKAIDLFTKCADVGDKLSEIHSEGICYYQIALVYHLMEKPEEAAEYYKRASALIDETDFRLRAHISHNLGAVSFSMDKLDTSISQFEEAIKLYKKVFDVAGQESVAKKLAMAVKEKGDLGETEKQSIETNPMS